MDIAKKKVIIRYGYIDFIVLPVRQLIMKSSRASERHVDEGNQDARCVFFHSNGYFLIEISALT